MQNKPYVSLYCDVLERAMVHLDKPDFRVLLALLRHVDDYGICYPGVRRLADMVKHAESTVSDAIERLRVAGFVRIISQYNAVRRRYETSFMLSPGLCAIRPELQDSVLRLWENLEDRNEIFINDVQPPPESESGITTREAPTATITTTTTINHSSPGSGDLRNAPGAGEPMSAYGAGNAKSKDANQTPAAQAAKTSGKAARVKSPPVPAHPPLPDGFDAKTPLEPEADERAAQELQRVFPTLTLINARRYVVRYSRDAVLTAAHVAKADLTAVNPVGKFDYLLRCGLVTPGVDDAAINRPEGIQDSLDKFVER